MNGINEIRKANFKKETAKEFSYTALRHGGVIVRRRTDVKTLDGPQATEFLTKAKDAEGAYLRNLISNVFDS